MDLDSCKQIGQVHLASAENDDTRNLGNASNNTLNLELRLEIHIVDGCRDIPGLAGVALDIVGYRNCFIHNEKLQTRSFIGVDADRKAGFPSSPSFSALPRF